MNTDCTAPLERQPRVSRCTRARANSIRTQPLQIILEESEPSSSTSTTSPSTTTTSPPPSALSSAKKARRRNCALSASDIQIARDFVGLGDDTETCTSSIQARLLLVPPPLTPAAASPDSFQLTFGSKHESYEFPHPPIPTPASLGSRHQSYCGASTPVSASYEMEDEEEFMLSGLPSPKFNPRRAAIQPLVIRKHLSYAGEQLLGPCKLMGTHPSPFTSGSSSCSSSSASSPSASSSSSAASFTSDEEEDEDNTSDTEFYTTELSKSLTLSAQTHSTLYKEKARPDSLFVPRAPTSKRISKPSGQLDPSYLLSTPRRRASTSSPRTRPHPSQASPRATPAPHRTSCPRTPGLKIWRNCSRPHPSRTSFVLSPPSAFRPPPRSSVPADFSFADDAEDDDESLFSFGVYAGSAHPILPTLLTRPLAASMRREARWTRQSSIWTLQTTRSCSPFLLPGTPIDLEADFAHGLEELRRGVSCPSPLPSVQEEQSETEAEGDMEMGGDEASISDFSFASSIHSIAAVPRTPLRDSWASFYVSEAPSSPRPAPAPPVRDSWASFYASPTPSPRAAPSPYKTAFSAYPPPPPPAFSGLSKFTIEDEERVLKSKWSSSTLGSIREEHARAVRNSGDVVKEKGEKEKRGSSRLRLFSPRKGHGRSESASAGLMSPLMGGGFVLGSPKKSAEKENLKMEVKVKKVDVKKSPAGARAMPAKKAKEVRSGSPVMTVAGPGVKRRGSCSTVSDSGSDVSAASSGSSGLRRKPIPVELFLRH
ncbi:hypothetical protein DFP72DRAFT_901444 [Ephemerocybe angulata]|uniref:Uncharacterized protein n=1 Tax=Ephemerocybe angulata TaxID=980116 RepID=A0A8H6HWU2_9AGAR|nr:hypothetical protein DFP72DRAFT_901444 [Tulosesus angulatus]